MFLNLHGGQNSFLLCFVFGFYSFAKNSANISASVATEGLPRGSEPVGREAPDFSHEAAQKCPFSTTDGGGRGWQSVTQWWHMVLAGRRQFAFEGNWRKEEEDRDLTLGFTLVTGFYVVGLTVIWIPSFIVSLYWTTNLKIDPARSIIITNINYREFS